MTITNLVTRNDYVASSLQTVFSYTFKLLSSSHVKVYVNDVLKSLTTDYSVSNVGNDAGGNITFVAGLVLNDVVALVRQVPLTQESDYIANDSFGAEVHEQALDKLTMAMQDLNRDQSNRVLKLPLASGLTNIEFPASTTRAGKTVRWTGDGTALEEIVITPGVDVSTITTKGDIVQGSNAGVAEKLAIGRASQVLRVVSDKAAWKPERATVTKSSNTTLTFEDAGKLILCDATSGAFTLIMPTPTVNDNGAVFSFVKVGTGYWPVTIVNNGGTTINGQASVVLRKPQAYVSIESNTDDSYIIARNNFRRVKLTQGVVTNGDFLDINQAVSQLGTNDSAWKTGQSWTIAGGLATMSGGADSTIQQTDVMSVGKTYRVRYTVSGRTAGQITVSLGSTAGTIRSTNGTFVENLACATDGNLTFLGETGFNGSITGVSVRLVSTTEIIPSDNTKPQITEGTKALMLKHIPSNSNNTIHIKGKVYVSPGTAAKEIIAALFVDSDTDAVACGLIKDGAADGMFTMSLDYSLKAGGVTEKTFHVRVGTGLAQTVSVDGVAASAILGGAYMSTLELVEEYV